MVSALSVPFYRDAGPVLAFIHAHSTLHRRAPAEIDFQAFFRVTPPTVKSHGRGLIARVPGQPRSITLLASPEPAAATSIDRNPCDEVLAAAALMAGAWLATSPRAAL